MQAKTFRSKRALIERSRNVGVLKRVTATQGTGRYRGCATTASDLPDHGMHQYLVPVLANGTTRKMLMNRWALITPMMTLYRRAPKGQLNLLQMFSAQKGRPKRNMRLGMPDWIGRFLTPSASVGAAEMGQDQDVS